MTSRRDFFKYAGIAGGAVAAGAVSRVAMAALPEPVIQTSPNTMAPLIPDSGRPYNPVVTLNGWTLPWRMNQGVKEFHLVAEPVVREMAPGMKAHLWGYNGQSPGPTIEVVEGETEAPDVVAEEIVEGEVVEQGGDVGFCEGVHAGSPV